MADTSHENWEGANGAPGAPGFGATVGGIAAAPLALAADLGGGIVGGVEALLSWQAARPAE
jgi:hypothetical protein